MIQELKKRIDYCEKQKKQLIEILQNLKNQCLNREITYSEYEKIIKEKRDGKTFSEWIWYYENYINECELKIKLEQNRAKKVKALSLFFAISLGLILLFFFISAPKLVGFITKQNSLFFTDNLNLEFNQSNYYEWSLKNPGELNSVKISGILEGSGSALIYLDDLLLYNSSSKKSTLNPLTGFSISEIDQEDFSSTIEDSENDSIENQTFFPIDSSEPSSNNSPQNEEENQSIPPIENTTPENETNNSENRTNTSPSPSEQPSDIDNVTDLPKPIKKAILFSNYCEETCDLSKYKMNRSSYTLKIYLDNTRVKISSLTYEIFSEENQGAEVPNITQDNSNLTINIDSLNGTKAIINLTRSEIIIGQTVKWKKNIKLEEPINFSIILPEQASNIKVKKISDSREVKEEVSSNIIKNSQQIHLAINDGASEYEIEYETSAPEALEENLSKKHKRIIISGPENPTYTDVFSFSSISEELKINSASQIRLFWIVNESRQEHSFETNDTDGNGIIDQLIWTTPHLSNQIFEIIIITKAEHLDKDREFISNIYEQVKSADDIWSETIKNKEFVRVTFERKLSSGNDITILPRITSGNPSIKIYEFNKSDLIAEFSSLNSNQYNKVYLTNLIGNQDIFDLEVSGGSVEFDHIIDPPPAPGNFQTLYLNNTAANSACPTTSMSLGINQPNSLIHIAPGEFDSTLPGTTDAGIWQPGIAAIANTTASTELSNPAQTTRNSTSFGRGWLYGENLTGYTLNKGNFSINLTLMGGQGANTLTERVMLRASIVNCTGANFYLVKDLTATNIQGEGSHSGGQEGWAASEGSRYTHPGAGSVVNIKLNVSTNSSHTFSHGEYLFIQLGFGDSNSNTDRTVILRYNIPGSHIITPNITDGTAPQVTLQAPSNGTSILNKTVSFNATFTDQFSLRNATLYIWDNSFTLINTTNRSIKGLTDGINITVDLPNTGTYYWNYLVADNSSNQAMNESNFTLIITDTTPPNISIIRPENITYTSTPIPFNVSLNEAGNACNYTLDNGLNNKTMSSNSSSTGFNATNSSIANGNYWAKFHCWDTSNNANLTNATVAFSVNIVVSYPGISFVFPTPANATTTPNSSIIINISINTTTLNNFTYNWNRTSYTFYDSSLIAMYQFDNNSALGDNATFANDSSTYSNGANISNAVYTLAGKYGSALNFSSSSVRPHNVTGTLIHNLTVAAWFNASTDMSINHAIVSQETFHNGTIRLFLYTTSTPVGRLAFDFANGDTFYTKLLSPTQLNDSNWHHVVVTRNNDLKNYSMYIDGVWVNGSTYAGNIGNNQSGGPPPIVIGNNPGGTMAFSGVIDEVLIYNRTWTSAEVSQAYMSHLKKSNLTLWYFLVNQAKGPTTGLDEGTYTYQAAASNTDGNSNQTDERTITISSSNNPPTVTIVYPFSNATLSSSLISFNATFTDDVNLTNATLYVWNGTDGNGVLINTTTQNITGTSASVNISFTIPSTGNYTMNYLVADNSSSTTWASNTTFRYHTIYDNTTYGGGAISFYRQNMTYPRPNKMSVAVVNLSQITFFLTPENLTGGTERQETLLKNTSAFALEFNTTLAVNANMFEDLNGGGYAVGDPGNIIGTWINNGTHVSPFNESGDTNGSNYGSPIEMAFNSSNHPYITSDNTTTPLPVWNGVGARDIILNNGVRQYCVFDTFASCTVANPRTLYGISKDNKTMFIVTIDGGQSGVSEGMTMQEASDYMLSVGAYYAVEMDGGGSSSLVIYNGTQQQIMNVPSNTPMRPVAASLGIYATPQTSQDTVFPNIQIAFPANSSNFSITNITVNYTASDDISLFNCWWTNSSGRINNTITCGTNISRIWLDGVSNVTVYANDTSGNVNFSSVKFTIDTTNPSVNGLLPIAGTNYTRGQSIEVAANVTDYLNVTVFANITLPNGTSNTLTLNNAVDQKFNNSYTIPSQVTQYNITIFANDTLNNINSTEQTWFYIPGTSVTECGNLTTANELYVLANDVNSTSTCFNVLANNITFDGNGRTVNYSTTGIAGHGFNISFSNFTKLINTKVVEVNSATSSKFAINLYRSSHGTYNNNTINVSGSSSYGLILNTNSNNNTISNNTFLTYTASAYGIYITSSANNTLKNNSVNSTRGISYLIAASSRINFNNSIDPTNLADGKPVNYTFDADNLTFNGVDFTSYGQVIFAYSRNITILNSNFSSDGLNFAFTNNSRIENSNFTTGTGWGIRLGSTSHFNIINNNSITTSTPSTGYALYLSSSSKNNITSNIIKTTGSSSYAIILESAAHNNTIGNNTISNTGSSGHGIYLSTTIYQNNFSNNNITLSGSSSYGIYFRVSPTGLNTFSQMSIRTSNSASYGIYLFDDNHNFTMLDSTLNSSAATSHEVFVAPAVEGGIWNFTNVTRAEFSSPLNVSWGTGANGTIITNWYLDVNVTDSASGAGINAANVNISDNNSTNYSTLTQSNGLARFNLIEYLRNGTSGNNRTYYSNYSINASATNYFSNVSSVNMSNNMLVNLSLQGQSTSPLITEVNAIPAQNPTENGATQVQLNFTVYDANGFADILGSSAQARFNKSGEGTRQNLSCVNINNYSSSYANFSCTIQVWYFDKQGTWSVNVSINDTSNAAANNVTTTFSVNQLSAFVASPSSLSFASISPGAFNTTSTNDPLLLNNTGNKPITVGNIQVNSTNLVGETDNSKAIYASNFSVGVNTGSSAECDLAAGPNNSTIMNKSYFQPLNLSNMSQGNHSANDGLTGQEQLYFCIQIVGSELSQQAYSTLAQGSWTIKILVVSLVLRRKKKKIKSDGLIKAFNLIIGEISEKYDLNKREVFKIISGELKDTYSLNKEELKEPVLGEEIQIPASIFSKDLGGLEAISKYLKENKSLTYHEIAILLLRDDRTVWTSYKKACEKRKDIIKIRETNFYIPITIFKNKKMTILESIILYLKKRNLTYAEIAKLLDRDQRNIWTICSRASKKAKNI